MASKLIVAVALFAVCHSSPIDEFRSKRSYTAAVGSSIGYQGKNTASATVVGDKADAQAYNENTDSNAHDGAGNSLPSQAYAKVGHYDAPNEAVRLGYAQPAYYPLPAPATVVAYQKYAAPEIPSQIVYEHSAPAQAHSSALVSDGYGSANSAANTGFGNAASLAQSAPAVLVEPAVIAAKTQGLHSVYTPAYTAGHNSASSSANVNGYQGSAVSAARTGAVPTRKSISWRFGTAYDQPAAYGAAKSAAANYGQGSAAAKSDVSGQALSAASNTVGSGSAQSDATNNGYGSSVRSSTHSLAGGSGAATANVNDGHYAVLRSAVPAGYGNIKSSASSHNGGSAISKASTDLAGNEYVDSAARSDYGGAAQSAAYNNGGAHGFRSNGAWGGHIGVDSYSQGLGNAVSSARGQGLSTGYRVTNSAANSAAGGAARSNAYTL